jgi:iron complex outermembrane recepter protein
MSHRVHKRARRAARAAAVTATTLPAILICGVAAAQQTSRVSAAQQTSSAASAQQTTATPTTTSQEPAANGDLQEVVVTGFRASLQSALDAKRTSIQPIESVAAEDIGKMPDQNVSESLQRLPGISINRSGGRAPRYSLMALPTI